MAGRHASGRHSLNLWSRGNGSRIPQVAAGPAVARICVQFFVDRRGQEDAAPEAVAAQAEPSALLPGDPKRSPLVGEPKTADELFEATLLMVDIVRVDLAKLYLDQLMEGPLDDDVLMALRDKYGAAPFLKLTNVPELKTQAVKLLDMSNAAAIKRANDPVRIAKLIRDLEGDPEQKAEAEAELESLGTAVVPGLLAVLNNPELVDRHESAMRAIVRVGDPAVPLLIGALEAPEESFRANVITLLGHLRQDRGPLSVVSRTRGRPAGGRARSGPRSAGAHSQGDSGRGRPHRH